MHAEFAYLFRHAVLRDAAYQLQLPGDRARLHALALSILEEVVPDAERDAIAFELSDHALKAADEDGRWLARGQHYLQRAARYASDRFRNQEAVRLWRACAAHTLADAAQKTQARIEEGKVHAGVGALKEARAALDEALAAAPTPGLRGTALSNRGAAHYLAGNSEEGLRDLELAVSLLHEAGEFSAEGVALNRLATLLRRVGKLAEAERHYARALDLVAAHGRPQERAIVLNNLAALYGETGRAREGIELCRTAVASDLATGNTSSAASAAGTLAVLYKICGELELAERTNHEALAYSRACGARPREGMALMNLAVVHMDAGRLDDALEELREAVAIARECGDARSEGLTLDNLGILHVQRGEFGMARRTFDQALRPLRATRSVLYEGLMAGVQAKLALLLGENEEAARHCARARELLEPINALEGFCIEALGSALRLENARANAERAHALLQEMRSLAMRTGAGTKSEIGIELGKCERLCARHEPSWRGHLLSEMSAQARIALLDYLAARDAAALAKLKEDPALYAAWIEGTRGLAVPDWR